MYIKIFRKSILLGLVVFSLVSNAQKPVLNGVEGKPNIIFIFTDDQAYNTLGVNGNDQVKTPNIDQLGKNGVIFDRHYNTTAVCMASRANLMSGLYEYKSGCNFMHGPLGTKQWSTSYPVLLRKEGYRVGFAGKFGFAVTDIKNEEVKELPEYYPVKDFDDYKGGQTQTSYVTAKNKRMVAYAKKYPHSTRSYGASTIDFIKSSVKEGKPFCASVYFKAPHMPLDPDPYFDDVYKNTVWKKPVNFGPEHRAHFSEQAKSGRQASYYNRFMDTDAKWQEYMRRYHQLIHGVDYSVGMILEALKELKIDDNTVVIFSSDNGSFLGSHGYGGKALAYEEGARVPLIVYDPRAPKKELSKRSASVTGNVDITATILDAAGIEVPEIYDGRSLLPVVYGDKEQARETLPVIQVWGPESSRALSVLNKDFKYIYWYYNDDKREMVATEELFDLNNDPYELKNLAQDPKYSEELIKMRKIYDHEVEIWSKGSVDYNGYGEYGQLLSRKLSWEEKAELIKLKDSKLKLRASMGSTTVMKTSPYTIKKK